MSQKIDDVDDPSSHCHAREVAKVLDITWLLPFNTGLMWAMMWLEVASKSKDSNSPI